MGERRASERTLTSFDSDGGDSTTEPSDASDDGDVDDEGSAEVHRVASQQGNDEYGTPRWLIRQLTEAIGGRFALDPAAGAEPTPIAEECYTKVEDGLSQDWTGVDGPIYLNPPYSDPEPWLKQLSSTVDPEASCGPDFAVALTKMDTSTGWFHDHLTDATVLCLLSERLSYYGGDSSASFASGISVFGDPPRALLEALGDVGALYAQVEVENALEQQTFDTLLSDGGATSVALPVEPAMPTAPAQSGVPGPANVSMEFVDPWEQLEVVFETESLGARAANVPEHIHVQVLRDGKRIEPETGSVIVDTKGVTPEGEDVCARLRSSARLVGHVEVSVAVGLEAWQTATPTRIRKVSSPQRRGSVSKEGVQSELGTKTNV
jgi:phage N-6-adenine-methyltransferase